MLLEEMMRNERQEGKLEGNTEGNRNFFLLRLNLNFQFRLS